MSEVSTKGQRSALALRSGMRRTLAALFALLAVGLSSFLWYIGVFTGNIRTVVPGRVYRSAQLSTSDLEHLIRAKGIRTVVSLRGGQAKDRWFRHEAETCRRAGVRLRVVRLRSDALPRPEVLGQLLEHFDRSQYPLLMHCKGGADRTGLAATIYLSIYQRVPLHRALEQQLTWRYGHFALQARAMDQFFELFANDPDAQDLRSWIRESYPSLYADAGQNEEGASDEDETAHSDAALPRRRLVRAQSELGRP